MEVNWSNVGRYSQEWGKVCDLQTEWAFDTNLWEFVIGMIIVTEIGKLFGDKLSDLVSS
jgi:hypothetical protein